MVTAALIIALLAFTISLISILANILSSIRFAKANDDRSRLKRTIILVLVSFSLAIMVWYFGVLQPQSPADTNSQVYGTLFSGLAFAALAITLYLQVESIETERVTQRTTRFETVFFQLLQGHHEIVKAMDFQMKESTSSGRDVFRTYYNQLKKECYEKQKHKPSTMQDFQEDKLNQQEILDYEIPIQEMLHIYEKIFSERESDLGHYFRNLYHIYKYIDEADIIDKQKYASLLRAQLSSFEFVFIFYNCLTPIGLPFKKYIVKYEGLKNMNTKKLFSPSHYDSYPDKAYGE